jgi:hypothetical protein
MAREILTMFNRFPELAATLPLAVGKIIKKTAFDIQARAMITAPIKTGFLRSSIYVMGKDYETYGQGVVGKGEMLPPVPKTNQWTTAIVAVGASYGIYIEMGARYHPARPYLLPAAEFVKPKMEEAFAQLELLWAEVGL